MITRPLRSLLLSLALLIGTCASAEAAPPKVVVTFSILGSMVGEIGGDEVSVTTLVAPGGDAHVYQPTPGDAAALHNADLVVVNGLGLEGWIDRLIAASGYRGKVITASQGVSPHTMIEEAGGKKQTTTDPHAWQDIKNGKIYAANIARALGEVDPEHQALFQQRAQRYASDLDELDGWVRQQIASVPAEKRKIITSHDAFGYFGQAYGVTFLAPVGINTDSEPTASQLGQLARQIKREQIKALFIETMTDPRLIAQLARESGATVGEALYSDTLSEKGGPADSYMKMFRHNVPAMAAAMAKN